MCECLEEKHRTRNERDVDGFKEDMSYDDRKKELVLESRLWWAFIEAVAGQERVAAAESGARSRRATSKWRTIVSYEYNTLQ